MFRLDEKVQELVFYEEKLKHTKKSSVCVFEKSINDDEVINFHVINGAKNIVIHALCVGLK
jgi:hypothetical protein